MSELKNNGIEAYMSFKLMGELYAVNVNKVLEILEMRSIIKLPKSQGAMEGVINLRNNVVPIIDVRKKLELGAPEVNKDTYIIVFEVQLEDELIILAGLVDEVCEVLSMDMALIAPRPSIGSKYKAEFINGIWKEDSDLIMLLNIDKVVSSDEATLILEEAESIEITEEINK